MIEATIDVGLAIERRDLSSTWGGHDWRPITIFASAPDVAPWTSLGSGRGFARFYAGSFPVHLYSTDTANYRDNLTSGAPKLWVVMRESAAPAAVDIALITADPAEGEASTEAGNNIVHTIDMPADIAGAVAAFVDANHLERPVIKRRRDGNRVPRHMRKKQHEH